ncbi:sensor histidine kinase [Vulcaniibacterium tengchongense]|uniref:Signal transduction histidine kinase n=1 Tax=Vulcaniibacterium tengchongense TaxID=1273429 RepID=A0A3N4VBQ6_9GAMM|nr:sensor histidine kinase [Vulcaniibacterium tengchongense]RPE77121.1 signal transduction histidine kinase [Vulcaniibacterium tengchongense]
MLARLNHTRLLRYAGLFTWAVVGVPLLYSWIWPLVGLEYEEGTAPPRMALPGWISYFAAGLSYAWLTRDLGKRRIRALDLVLLLVLTGSAVSVSYFSSSGLGSVLLMVAASVLPWLLSVPVGVSWLLLSQLAVVPLFVRALGFSWVEAVMQSVLYAGFSTFVFVTSLVAKQQAEAREEQRRLNAELRATRALLGESVRVNERTRISRELHDLLGHHLTALSLNLEVAGHLSEGRVKEHVQQAHTLARLLLTDVREAVSQLREGGAIDLSAAMLPLAENVPSLDIHMDVQSPLTLDDPERAHVLLRCTQEIITNAVRHAGARNLWIAARRNADGCIVVDARDDGHGADLLVAGNGLRGMRERLLQHGGQLTIETRPGAGFRLHLTLPASAAAAAACEGAPA